MSAMLPVLSMPGYFAADDGTIWSSRRGTLRELAQNIDHQKYPTVRVFIAGRKRPIRRKVPRLVAEAFHGPRADGLQIRHLDGNPGNNRPENLKYGTAAENAADRIRHGTQTRGERSHNTVFSDAEVRAAVERVIAGELMQDVDISIGASLGAVQKWCRGMRSDATAGLDLKSIPYGRQPSGNRNALTRVSDEQIIEMKALAENGLPLVAIAPIYGVHPATVSRLVRGVWRAAA